MPPPPAPTEFVGAAPRLLRLPRIRWWYWVIALLGLVLCANAEKLPLLWAEVFYRTPSDARVEAIAREQLPAVLGRSDIFDFEFDHPIKDRRQPGVVLITLSGTAKLRQPLFEPVSIGDPALGLGEKVRALREAQAKAEFLRSKGGAEIAALEKADVNVVRETAPTGRQSALEFAFEAVREGRRWKMQSVQRAGLREADAFRGQLLASFTSETAVLGTDSAQHVTTRAGEQIDKFVASVAEAEKAMQKRFAAEGKDQEGNPVFPNQPLIGERYPQTRMQFLDPNDLQRWPEDALQYAINEIFARRGAEFGNKQVADWFRQFVWYTPKPGLSFEEIEASFSEVELQNVRALAYARTAAREYAAQQRTAVAKQAQQAAASQRAQQEAARRAQQEEMAERFLRSVLQGMSNGLRRR